MSLKRQVVNGSVSVNDFFVEFLQFLTGLPKDVFLCLPVVVFMEQ